MKIANTGMREGAIRIREREKVTDRWGSEMKVINMTAAQIMKVRIVTKIQ
ncbi:hypothetical protein [Burkholderia metallica]|nr:hypothetical protein [Burkholderia metallica]MCA8023444.1 hypothetical protein [Burkholderia metallica]